MNSISSFDSFSANLKKSYESYISNLDRTIKKRSPVVEGKDKQNEQEEVSHVDDVPSETRVVESVEEIIHSVYQEPNPQPTVPTLPAKDEYVSSPPVQPVQDQIPQYRKPEPVEPIGYKIFRDKVETFQCRVYVEGSTLANTRVRLFLDSDEWNLVFYGSIDSEGLCKIPLKKITILSEYCTGDIRLEVISDDTVFTPWTEKFTVIQSKKVSVEIIQNTETNGGKPGIKISDIR